MRALYEYPLEKITPQCLWESALVTELGATEQDPQWHGEGDVLTHTRMVANELATAPNIVRAAGILHDVGKARTTVLQDGRLTAPHHSRVGGRRVAWHMWLGDLATSHLPTRHALASLVQLHGLPRWVIEKDDPEYSIIRASYTVRLDWLYQLAVADWAGRIAADTHQHLEYVELFRVLAEELGCFKQPFAFDSPDAQVAFFIDRKPLHYKPYVEPRPTVTLLSGLPGAGKDTWLATNWDGPVVSLDDIRRSLGVSPTDEQGQVAQAAREKAREYLRAGVEFAWNATNITRRTRTPLVALFRQYGARVRIVYVDAGWPTIRARNVKREHPVPEGVIQELARRLEIPQPDEAHDVLWVSHDD